VTVTPGGEADDSRRRPSHRGNRRDPEVFERRRGLWHERRTLPAQPHTRGDDAEGSTMTTKVLLVEDNELNRDMLSRRLARAGYQVAIATSGEEALLQLALGRPDVVLLDMGLPGIDGWETVRRIRQSRALIGLPVIALTAHALDADRAAAIAAGCDDYDTKPIDLPRLLAKIEALR
jgi:CheY-like chemotaxis protein